MSPYLAQPLRTEEEARAEHEQALFERDDRYHRNALQGLLEREEGARLQYMNCGNCWLHLSSYDKQISALKYAIERLEKAAAERVRGAGLAG